jgi:hypothetical protein
MTKAKPKSEYYSAALPGPYGAEFVEIRPL